ncbi:MAG: BLUF domain-containing protein [Paracoccus sp. (in: a-proteobacteria)]
MTNRLDGIEGLGFFLYRSNAAKGVGAEALRQILGTARSRNQSLGLTGCLHYEDGLFFQWLEGPVCALRPVFVSISQDQRHERLEVLDAGGLDHRRFQDWRMRYSDRDQVSLLDWFARSDSSTVDRGDYAGGVTAFLLSLRA